MRRLAPLALLVIAVAACGGSAKHAVARPTDVLPGGKALYVGGDWAVVVRGTTAVAAHLAGGAWHRADAGGVTIDILGPHGRGARRPQVAAELKAPSRLVEEGLWLDGSELLEKGGGLKPNNVTVYGAPDANIKPGRHVAVAYGRTATGGTAVVWTFTVV
jgi:hypothetical protein